ncbi:MAG: hypothetical protein A4E65_02626 [Syntrophorhabdus sp. PtaU1.Bin153]|nr:MAG: hypothetical protein A4E65_02626 [Syntrophorhabdus sp. PtaU1.Bin153]
MEKKKWKFSGHETFVFRHGWLEKGYRFVKAGKSFGDENAIVDLGVGKNMVESIRYWCEATTITVEGKTSPFADALLDSGGWDPFLEDDASLWLIHWKMINNQNLFTSGSAIFSLLHRPEFTKRDVTDAVMRRLADDMKKLPSQHIILRDVECYLRLYVGTKRLGKTKAANDESFDCPLQNLGMINLMNDADMYRFAIGPKPTLPPEIVGYAIWDYCRSAKRSSIRIQEALYHAGSPGQVFMLDENSLVEAIYRLNSDQLWGEQFSFSESAGIALIECSLSDGDELLSSYYNKGRQQ